jgi:pimeloyl-ACP methyl ester carboxylesterase
MKKITKILKWILILIVLLYSGICMLFYFTQEKLLFNTSVKLKHEHVFSFTNPFEERYITMADKKNLHGVLFKAKESKGLILWLPGGRGMLDSIGVDAHFYTDLNYDLFVLNFRGFGKSEGKISSEKQFNQDMQTVYDYFKKEYLENNIVIFGYSLGTGPAAALAAGNNPKMLILKAPYFSMEELTQKAFPYLPIAILQKYEFPTSEYLEKVKCPVVIFHGDADQKIPIEASYQLKKQLKPSDKLIILKGQGHNNFENNSEYLKELSGMLQ